ncbi:recombinase family protein [Adlercreutzia sp. ZJ138]|uniref:recombinase family protein n=1 Tax=Adlercreutzia sp. ZJ138 TaxID=2709405 RepID=UPI0013EA5ADE|nr:recombinase family protein [Adlercreutzia sp. ZJ138]
MTQTIAQKMYGYARVSSKDQHLDRQLAALEQFGVEPSLVYADKASGKDFNRPEYQKLVARLRKGDVLVVKSIDRLGRNYDEVIEEWRRITKDRGANVVVLDMPLLDTRERQDGITGVFIADLVLQLLSYVAQIERESIKQRQAEGIAAAQARGVRFGRPRKRRPASYSEARRSFQEGRITRKQAAACLKVSPSTFDRWIREDDDQVKESA